jgi:hypothetical protein
LGMPCRDGAVGASPRRKHRATHSGADIVKARCHPSANGRSGMAGPSGEGEGEARVRVYGRVRYQAQGYDCTLQRGRRVRQPGWYRGWNSVPEAVLLRGLLFLQRALEGRTWCGSWRRKAADCAGCGVRVSVSSCTEVREVNENGRQGQGIDL